MKFFIDTADVEAIRELNAGLVDGVTTNPSLIMKSGRDIVEVTKEICDIVSGPVSRLPRRNFPEWSASEVLARIADNICIKLPLTMDGLRACKTSDGPGPQDQRHAVLFGQSGSARGEGGSDLHFALHRTSGRHRIERNGPHREIRAIYDNYDFATEILAASIRSVNHVKEAALIGADVATIPPAILTAAVKTPADRQGWTRFWPTGRHRAIGEAGGADKAECRRIREARPIGGIAVGKSGRRSAAKRRLRKSRPGRPLKAEDGSRVAVRRFHGDRTLHDSIARITGRSG